MSERFKMVGGVFNIILKDNKVLMELRKNKFDDGMYSLVGGCMEDGETVKQVAVREIKEEVALDVDEKDCEVVSIFHRMAPDGWQSTEFVLIVKKFCGNPKLMENEVCGDLRWFDLATYPPIFRIMQKRQLITISIKRYFQKLIFNLTEMRHG